MDALLGVVDLGRGTEPGIILQVRRNRLLWIIRGRGINGQSDLNTAYLPYAAGADQLTRETELGGRALLAANLHDASRPGDEITQQDSFPHSHRERLLDIYVLARENRRGNDLRVPVIGRADDHRIEVRVFQPLSIVGIHMNIRNRATGLLVVSGNLLLAVSGALRVEVA